MKNSSTIQSRIVSDITEEIDKKTETNDRMINELVGKINEGSIPSMGQAFINHVRDIRRNTLAQYQSLKTDIYNEICNRILRENRTEGISRLQELVRESNEVTAEKAKALKDIEHIQNEDMPLSDYKKYMLFGDRKKGGPNQSQDNQTGMIEWDYTAVNQAYDMYIAERNKKYIWGILVTLICIIADFSIMLSVYMSSNLSELHAYTVAIVSVAMLDMPPYFLGILWNQRGDRQRLWELRIDEEDSGAAITEKYLTRVGVFLIISMFFIFLTYLVMRILLFMGGGEFDIAMHNLIEGNFKFEGIEFRSADLLSIFVPFGTSAVAFAAGILFSSSYTDFVKKEIVIINKELQSCIKRLQGLIVDYDKSLQNIDNEKLVLKREIWTLYMGEERMPQNDDEFNCRISFVFRKLNMQLYIQTYQEICILLRNRAIGALHHINEVLVIYSANQNEMTLMQNSEEEKELLDDFWVMDSFSPQHEITMRHLDKIRGLIEELEHSFS